MALMGLVKKYGNEAWTITPHASSLFHSYQQLVGVRVCLGVTEAGLFPGVVY